MKNFFKILFLGVIVGIIIMATQLIFMVASGNEILFDRELLKIFWYHQLFAVVLTLVNAYYYEYLDKKIEWQRYGKYRIVIGAVGAITLTMFTIFLIRVFIMMGIEGKTWEEFVAGEKASYYLFSLLITIIVSITFHAIYFYKELQKNKVKEQKIIAGTATAQFDALKNQLDPHFLFNSLNVLTSLIDENPGQAQKFTTSLSKVYRYVLEQKNKELVSVDEELKFAKTYVSLLKNRFENSIIFEIPEQSENPDAKVVPLSLQLLLENAVKHNMVNESNPLHIRIYEEEGCLVVKNNLQLKQVINKSSGVGLLNIRQRYDLLTNRKVEVEKTEAEFIVKLPMLTKQASVMRSQIIDDNNKYVRARKRVEDLKEFYTSLMMYPIVIPFLIFINYKTSWGFQWFWFPMIGWGIGLLFHAYKVYFTDGILGRNWEERKIRQYMEENDSNTHWE